MRQRGNGPSFLEGVIFIYVLGKLNTYVDFIAALQSLSLSLNFFNLQIVTHLSEHDYLPPNLFKQLNKKNQNQRIEKIGFKNIVSKL